MAQESPSRGMDKVIVRLPDGMRDRIKAAAEASNRSMNAEIVATLEEKYPAPKFLTREERYAYFLEILRDLEERDLETLDQKDLRDLRILQRARQFFERRRVGRDPDHG